MLYPFFNESFLSPLNVLNADFKSSNLRNTNSVFMHMTVQHAGSV